MHEVNHDIATITLYVRILHDDARPEINGSRFYQIVTKLIFRTIIE